jgi:hypothetical protein
MQFLSIQGNTITTISSPESWEPSLTSEFIVPSNDEEFEQIKNWTLQLSDGEMVPLRGRDIIRDENMSFMNFSEWEYGIGIKLNRRIFLLWGSRVESVLIDGCDYVNQLHYEMNRKYDNILLESAQSISSNLTIILSHGFSFTDGPNYALIRVLSNILRKHGYSLIIPDFRPRFVYFYTCINIAVTSNAHVCICMISYKFGPSRGRSERVKIILEELIYLVGNSNIPASGDRHKVVLIGHSQGGAASAQV